MSPVEVTIIPGSLAASVLLDASQLTDQPADILQAIRVELAKIDQSEHRNADVIIRARPQLLALLRLMRWDCLFDFQEVTGEQQPRHLKYHWKTGVPARTFHDTGERP